MAVLKDDSLKRRRSIAVPNQNKQAISASVGRRRAYSIAPGERLNGLDKARRSSFAPRKSILKTSSLVNTEETSEQPSNSQSSQPEDGNTTQSMDFTVDYRARLHDNAARKSLGRRVSFAEHAHVRLFQIPNHDNTNSTGSPQSSPIPSSSPEVNQLPAISNENDYPASFSRNRRSSMRYSIAGSDDMDLTMLGPGIFPDGEEGSMLMNQEMIFDDNTDMEVTEVLPGRRRSLIRQPLAPVRHEFPSDDDDNISKELDKTRSVVEDDSQMQSEAENSQGGMDFTVPMGQSLRPPPTEDPVWLALRQVTHSGDTPHEPDASSEDDIQADNGQPGMDLNDAMVRLMRARDSMDTGATMDMDITVNANFMVQEDSLSTDDSLNDDAGDRDETLNVSKVIGRMSLGGNNRMSLGHQESTMEESGIYESIQPLSSSTPRQSIALPPQIQEQEGVLATHQEKETGGMTPTPVFQAPVRNATTPLIMPSTAPPVQEPLNASIFTFVPPPAAPATPRTPTRPASPLKSKPKPTFSAAFAPPVTKPSPKKQLMSSTSIRDTTNKRPFSVMQDGIDDSGRPSPAKRPALAHKVSERPSSSSPKKGPMPPQSRSSFSPNKKALLNGSGNLTGAAKRQSGYFARRKSLGNAQVTPREGNLLDSVSPVRTDALDKTVPTPPIPTAVLPTEWTQAESFSEQLPQLPLAPSPSRASPVPSFTTAAISSEGPEQFGAQCIDVGKAKSEENIVIEPSISQEEIQPQENVPSISIQQFFSMTGIKFMDELTAPRRSIHPHISTRQIRSPGDIPLSEYYIAMGIEVPQLGLFSRVSKDLEGWMVRSKGDFAQAEEEAAKITPELFIEFMRADEEGQAELLHQLNLIRVNTRGQAKSDWYDWKLRWVEGLQLTAKQASNDLQADAKILGSIKEPAEKLVPILEKECDDNLRELQRDQAEITEIEASDPEFHNDLKVSIAEQNIEIEALRAELSEHTEQVKNLQGRLEELMIGKKENTDAIAKAQHVLQMKENSTRTEVFRLCDELETLEDLHQFHITKVEESMFEYIHASHFKVIIPCNKYLPIPSRVEINRVDGATLGSKDDFPKLSNILNQGAKALVHYTQPVSCKEIIHFLSDYWSSCSQLRAQLRLLSIKYPIEILPMDCGGLPAFKAKTKVMIPAKKAKVFVTFNFTPEVLSRWPLSITSLTCDVDVGYGPVDKHTILEAVSNRLGQATPADNYACLLDTCIEAQEIYNQ